MDGSREIHVLFVFEFEPSASKHVSFSRILVVTVSIWYAFKLILSYDFFLYIVTV